MSRRLVGIAVLGLAGLVGSSALAAAPSAYQRPVHTDRVSVSSTGAQARYPLTPPSQTPCRGQAGDSDISADGRYVAFTSDADNLVAGDTNQGCDVFRHDRATGLTIRVSVASDGSQAVGVPTTFSGDPSISADGRYVAFESNAPNLAPGTISSSTHLFVHDTKSHTTRWVSKSYTGGELGVDRGLPVLVPGADASTPRISANGRFLAWQSNATNVTPGFKPIVPPNSNYNHIYVMDLKTGKNVLASVADRTGAHGDRGGGGPSISGDGRYVAFHSSSTNLVPGNTLEEQTQSHPEDVYVRDLKGGRTHRVSVASDGSQASYAVFPSCTLGGQSVCLSFRSQISDDGRYVTFLSNATNLVPNDGNYTPYAWGVDAFVHDLKTGRTERASVGSSGQENRNEEVQSVAMSGDGNTIGYSFDNRTQNAGCPQNFVLSLLPADPTLLLPESVRCALTTQSYAHNRATGARDSLALTPSGAAAHAGRCTPGSFDYVYGTSVGAFSKNGRHASVFSSADNLVTGDTNNACDYFVRDRGPSLGVGGLAANGKLTVAGSTGFAKTGMLAAEGSLAMLSPALDQQGAELLGARAVYRAGTNDLFLRLDLTQMPTIAGTVTPGLLYGWRFTANGVQYQVRAQRLLGPDYEPLGGASFGLFRETAPGVWTRVASLEGGYGTVGDAVVSAVPLSAVALSAGGQLSEFTAYTAVGSYLSGATKVLDSLRLSR